LWRGERITVAADVAVPENAQAVVDAAINAFGHVADSRRPAPRPRFR
jgi:hypothetical protein